MRRRARRPRGVAHRARDHPTGVLLLTGTALVPPADFTLAPGDVVAITITGLGSLVNPVERIEIR